MSLTINLRELDQKDLYLTGDLPLAELELERLDDLIHAAGPLHYDLEVQQVEEAVLVEGELSVALTCECVRCLKAFPFELVIDNYVCHLPLEGEEKVKVENDSIDLTPHLREDIILAFPQHPLCEPECVGLAGQTQTKSKNAADSGADESKSSVWDALDKLKLNE